MTELDGVGVSTMFAADAEFDVFFRFAAFFDRDFHEFADAGLIEAGEGVFLEDLILGVGIEEGAHVVAADAECGLGEIVCAEAEELGGLRDFISGDRATRDFDHGANEVVKFDFLLGHHGLGGSIGFCDPDAGIGFAYCCNKMHAVGTNGPRAKRLIDALYSCG